MAKEEFMQLAHSESVVAQMAATVFAGLVQKHPGASEDELVARSVAIAVKLAAQVEKIVKSDEEWANKDKGSAYLAG